MGEACVAVGAPSAPLTLRIPSRWRYRTEDSTVYHIGPTAQDFHAAFGLNGPDDTHIATVDADGVSLAAIKGLHQLLLQQSALLEQQGEQLRDQDRTIDELQRQIDALRTILQQQGTIETDGEMGE